MSEFTRVLEAAYQGDPKAAAELLPLVYEDLRRLAAHKMASEAPGHTLQPTALVHEAWLRVAGSQNLQWGGRAHFFAAAAEAMRRILIERARRKRAARHGGDQIRAELDDLEIVVPSKDEELLAVSEALEKFEAYDKQKSDFVKLRYFVGFTLEEAAETLGISVPTASRWWTYSRAWLAQELKNQPGALRNFADPKL